MRPDDRKAGRFITDKEVDFIFYLRSKKLKQDEIAKVISIHPSSVSKILNKQMHYVKRRSDLH